LTHPVEDAAFEFNHPLRACRSAILFTGSDRTPEIAGGFLINVGLPHAFQVAVWVWHENTGIDRKCFGAAATVRCRVPTTCQGWLSACATTRTQHVPHDLGKRIAGTANIARARFPVPPAPPIFSPVQREGPFIINLVFIRYDPTTAASGPRVERCWRPDCSRTCTIVRLVPVKQNRIVVGVHYPGRNRYHLPISVSHHYLLAV